MMREKGKKKGGGAEKELGYLGLERGSQGPEDRPGCRSCSATPGLLAPSPGCGGLGSHGLGGYLGSRQHKAQPQV